MSALTPRATRYIRLVSVGSAALIALCAVILSYSGLHALAIQSGISPRLAVLLPVVVDGTAVTGMAGVLYSTLAGIRTWYPWLLVLLGVAVSVWGNWVAAPPDLVAKGVHAASPLILALVLEELLRVTRHRVRLHQEEAQGQADTRASLPGIDASRSVHDGSVLTPESVGAPVAVEATGDATIVAAVRDVLSPAVSAPTAEPVVSAPAEASSVGAPSAPVGAVSEYASEVGPSTVSRAMAPVVPARPEDERPVTVAWPSLGEDLSSDAVVPVDAAMDLEDPAPAVPVPDLVATPVAFSAVQAVPTTEVAAEPGLVVGASAGQGGGGEAGVEAPVRPSARDRIKALLVAEPTLSAPEVYRRLATDPSTTRKIIKRLIEEGEVTGPLATATAA
jgi:hypothetical protein